MSKNIQQIDIIIAGNSIADKWLLILEQQI